jgi:hypothetical protein
MSTTRRPRFTRIAFVLGMVVLTASASLAEVERIEITSREIFADARPQGAVERVCHLERTSPRLNRGSPPVQRRIAREDALG